MSPLPSSGAGFFHLEHEGAMRRKEKAKVIDEVAEALENAEALFVSDYRGLTVAQLTALRGQLRQQGATLHVLKNTLAKIAADRSGREVVKELLSGPTAVTFCGEDPVAPAKTLSDFSRTNPSLVLRGGVLQGSVIDAEGVRRLAQLPPRDVVIAQVVGTMAAPLSGLVTVLQGTISGLVRALDQVAQQKAAA